MNVGKKLPTRLDIQAINGTTKPLCLTKNSRSIRLLDRSVNKVAHTSHTRIESPKKKRQQNI